MNKSDELLDEIKSIVWKHEHAPKVKQMKYDKIRSLFHGKYKKVVEPK